MNSKYVITENSNGIQRVHIMSAAENHADILPLPKGHKLVSAGMFQLGIKVWCFDRSTSLNIQSQEGDAFLIAQHLGVGKGLDFGACKDWGIP